MFKFDKIWIKPFYVVFRVHTNG